MGEVEELCNQVAVIRSGRIAYEGPLDDLRGRAGIRYRLRTKDDAIARRVCEEHPGTDEVEDARPNGLSFKAEDEEAVAELSVVLTEAGRSDPRAHAAAGLARGSLLRAHRGQ